MEDRVALHCPFQLLAPWYGVESLHCPFQLLAPSVPFSTFLFLGTRCGNLPFEGKEWYGFAERAPI